MLDYGKHIIEGKIEPSKLVFKTRISRGITNYKVNNLVKSVLLQLRDLGIKVEPGQYVQYVVRNEHTRDYKERVCVVQSLSDDEAIDVKYYLRQIAKCGESILVPFGYTLEKLEEMLYQLLYQEMMNVSVLSRNRTNQTCF